MDKKKSIETLQVIVTALSNGAFIHLVQGKHFEAMGLTKLGEKYAEHYTEEMEWVTKCIERINNLGASVKIEPRNGAMLVNDPIEYISEDLKIQKAGVEMLYNMLATLKDDPTTYDLLKAYLLDEEEDLYWSEEQLDLIELIGKQNWLTKQL